MKLQNKEVQIELLKNRIQKLRENGEQMNRGLIAKATRQLRAIEKA